MKVIRLREGKEKSLRRFFALGGLKNDPFQQQ